RIVVVRRYPCRSRHGLPLRPPTRPPRRVRCQAGGLRLSSLPTGGCAKGPSRPRGPKGWRVARRTTPRTSIPEAMEQTCTPPNSCALRVLEHFRLDLGCQFFCYSTRDTRLDRMWAAETKRPVTPKCDWPLRAGRRTCNERASARRSAQIGIT